MATLSSTAKNAAVDAITALLDSGFLEFRTSGDVAVATLALNGFSAAVNGVATANEPTADTDAAGGTIAKAVLLDSSDAVVATLTVGLTGSAAEITMGALVIPAAETVAVSSFTISTP